MGSGVRFLLRQDGGRRVSYGGVALFHLAPESPETFETQGNQRIYCDCHTQQGDSSCSDLFAYLFLSLCSSFSLFVLKTSAPLRSEVDILRSQDTLERV